MTEIQWRSDVVARHESSMGNDDSILRAMLVSSDKDDSVFQMEEQAKVGKIKFLMKNRHGSPFEHNSMTFYVEAPIFVFREWHRHRIGQSYNEQSGRYSELPPMFYIPPVHRPLVQVGKPGAYEFVPGTEEQYRLVYDTIVRACENAYADYQMLLRENIGREVARMVLPVNIYSKMYCTINARSMMNFLSLRTHEPEAAYPSKPMWEIEQAARLTEAVFADLFPITYAAFNEFGRVAP